MWLLLGKYREDMAILESQDIVRQYEGVTKLRPEWEDGWFNLARYYDKVMNIACDDDRSSEHKK